MSPRQAPRPPSNTFGGRRSGSFAARSQRPVSSAWACRQSHPSWNATTTSSYGTRSWQITRRSPPAPASSNEALVADSPPADRLRRRRGSRRWSHYWRKGRPILVAELTGNGLLHVVGDKGLQECHSTWGRVSLTRRVLPVAVLDSA